ncbi:MAG: carboxypeptidase regulatory-like domain-containing protein [Pyrinomonadaceae bacterium]
MRITNLKANVVKTFALFFAIAMLVFSVYAQSGTSGVSGVVRDSNRAIVPGATVTLLNPATGFKRTTTTNSEGAFSFAAVPPSTYQLEVTANSFKKLVNTDLKLAVDSPIRFDPVLEAGEVSATVTVTTSSIESVVNDQDATIGNNFVPKQITDLPTNLRRINDLLNLQPGVTRDGYVAGGRSDQANVTLDGIDINDQQTGGRSGQFATSQDTALRLTAESVEEFRITTTGANANQGRSSGAQISLITKSGTNNFRGAVFYFYRPTALSSNDFFSNQAGVERGSLARPVFGGAIGGPILKDKLFFFYSYEGQREKRDQSVVRTVPLASLGQGQLRFFGAAPGDPAGTNRLLTLSISDLNGIYSQAGINPAAVAVFADAASRFPANDPGVGDGLNTGGFRFNAPTTDDEDTHIARFDLNINDRQTLFLRLNYQNDNANLTQNFPDSPSSALWEHPYGFAVGHNWTINSNLVNNFRYGLTRQAFSQQGDSGENSVSFRFVFSPLLFSRTLSRITPTHNISDDVTWIKGNHTIQFGGNIRIIRNQRVDSGNAYDDAITNPSFYDLSGGVVDAEIRNAGYTIGPGQRSNVQNAATALIGRFSQYSGNFTFDIDGSVLPAGTPSERTFATEEYDTYIQDVWKLSNDLTITGGLRYGLSRPVYEKNGFQVIPSERLGDFFERRQASAARGIPLNDLIQFELGGPANNGPGFYSLDTNNFQPRIAAAWSPSFKNGFLGKLFGKNKESVFRGGFSITNDYFGQQLAVSFDGLSPIGFTSSVTIAANTYNVTDNLAPRFTGFGQDVRSLPGIPPPVQRFDTPADEAQRIESSLDGTIVSPTHYSWNVSYGRQLPKGMYFEASYIGRKARNLFGARDVNALNNLVDPISGQDWYTAAGLLVDARNANVPINSLGSIPFFENYFPGIAGTISGLGNTSTQEIFGLIARDGFDIADYTFVQLIIDDAGIVPNLFFHPQYAAFSAFGTFARSDYNGASFSLRQRFGTTLSYDINYTFSKSFDNVSGLQSGGSFGSQFLLNPLRPDDNYSVSDFDTNHVINANFLFDGPIGRGKALFSGIGKFADALIGGWQLRGIYRWNTGQPLSVPFDQAQWATNWNVQSNGTRIRPVNARAIRSTQNIFADPAEAFRSFRNARPGETGERNSFRLPGFQSFDLGLAKVFSMPWDENHKLQFRAEVYNLANHQSFTNGGETRTTYGLPQDPDLSTAPSNFGRIFIGTQGDNDGRRYFQFGFRYSF